jgi:ribosome assembly protein YihI (activator of Der GTPase)
MESDTERKEPKGTGSKGQSKNDFKRKTETLVSTDGRKAGRQRKKRSDRTGGRQALWQQRAPLWDEYNKSDHSRLS